MIIYNSKMSHTTISGRPAFPHLYVLYISGTVPITLVDNQYTTIIQTDSSNITINLPASSYMMGGGNLNFKSGGGILTLTAYAGDNIEGSSTAHVTADSSCLLTLHKTNHTWNIIYNISSIGYTGPVPFNSQIIYVNMGGNDTTGNGTLSAPYLTILNAMATITDALWEKRYIIELGPGNWADIFTWKAWVYINGPTNGSARLTGNININDPSWANPGSHSDVRSGAQNLTFVGNLLLDFTTQPSPYGKFYFWNCNMNNVLIANGYNSVNQIIIQGGVWFAGITWSCISVLLTGSICEGGALTCGPSSNGNGSFIGVGG